MQRFLASLFALFFIACQANVETPPSLTPNQSPSLSTALDTLSKWERFFAQHPNYLSDGFDYPVGKPDGKGYYNAQPFGKNDHLGDDWNATTGGNSDLGDPIYAIGNGYVVFAQDISGGWGNVVRVLHKINDSTYVESIYAHCDSILTPANQGVLRGQQIATIGNCNGAYYAHLHLEIRDSVEMEIGGGYSSYYHGYLDPTLFIDQHRPKK